jgi:hypothetical protein
MSPTFRRFREKANTFEGGLAALSVANAMPLLLSSRLPFTDLAEHEATIATLAHWGTAAYSSPYRIASPHYLLCHLLGAILCFVTGSAELSVKLLLFFAAVAIPWSIYFALRSLDRDPRLAILSPILVWCRPLGIGFLPFFFAIPFTIVCIALSANRTLRHRSTFLALSLAALFFIHTSGLFVALPCVFLLAIPNVSPEGSWWQRGKGFAKSLWPMLPVLTLTAMGSMVGRLALRGQSVMDPGEVSRMNLRGSFLSLPRWTFDIWRSHGDELAAVLFWLAVLVASTPLFNTPEDRRLHRGWIPFFTVSAIFLLTPFRIGAATMLNVRLAPLVVASLLFSLPRIRDHRRTLLFTLAGLATALSVGNAFREIALAQADWRGLDETTRDIPAGSRVLTLDYSPASSRTHFATTLYSASYWRARRGGVATFSFSELAHWPLQFQGQPPPSRHPFWVLDPLGYDHAFEGSAYTHILVHGDPAPIAALSSGTPPFDAVAHAGDFWLFRRQPDPSAP